LNVDLLNKAIKKYEHKVQLLNAITSNNQNKDLKDTKNEKNINSHKENSVSNDRALNGEINVGNNNDTNLKNESNEIKDQSSKKKN